MANKKQPNPIDIHVGSRVRLRRMMLGMSQEKLGESLGITFQQIQKYEKGTNRIGASRLQHIARVLTGPGVLLLRGCARRRSGRTGSAAWPSSRRRATSSTSCRVRRASSSTRRSSASRMPSSGGSVIDLVRAMAGDEDDDRSEPRSASPRLRIASPSGSTVARHDGAGTCLRHSPRPTGRRPALTLPGSLPEPPAVRGRPLSPAHKGANCPCRDPPISSPANPFPKVIRTRSATASPTPIVDAFLGAHAGSARRLRDARHHQPRRHRRRGARPRRDARRGRGPGARRRSRTSATSRTASTGRRAEIDVLLHPSRPTSPRASMPPATRTRAPATRASCSATPAARRRN